ncbi:YchJ family protein [Comamonas nitrativorans]|uniref:UPF0225 protein ACFO3A_06735 n=1 Tax=Comamonas nitrativorans TaxID=108437 RepID=A0ABV9GX78_9BURK
MSRTVPPCPACPCGCTSAKGQPLAYAACCGRFIDHYAEAPAPDAEHLMRSRYSAFVREDAAYLLATWHPDTRPASLDFDPGVQWLGLQVKAFATVDDHHATVEFVARYRQQGRAVRLHERSRFVREAVDGLPRWWYVDGDVS